MGFQVGQRVVDLDDCSGGLGVGQVGRLAVVQLHRLGDLLERVVPPPRRLLVHVVRRGRDSPASLVSGHQSAIQQLAAESLLQDICTYVPAMAAAAGAGAPACSLIVPPGVAATARAAGKATVTPEGEEARAAAGGSCCDNEAVKRSGSGSAAGGGEGGARGVWRCRGGSRRKHGIPWKGASAEIVLDSFVWRRRLSLPIQTRADVNYAGGRHLLLLYLFCLGSFV